MNLTQGSLQSTVEQTPRSLPVQRRDQLGDASLEVHAVAAQAVVHQQLSLVVALVQEDLRVAHAVGPVLPVGVLLCMATGAVGFEG